jgi:hypothetical protein
MPSTEEQIQRTVVSLDAGELRKWIWRAIFTFVAIGLSAFYLTGIFRGLPISEAMDQAQVGREIIRGHGWSTEFARPLAIGELEHHGKDLKTAAWKDTYNAPIPPLLDAIATYIPIKEGWALTKTDFVYAGDRAIALMGVIFFLASVVVLYFVALELFDERLAQMAVGLVLICEMMWRYAISGLPQMFLLLMLNVNIWILLRAMRAQYLNESTLKWSALLGLGFGIMALTHALSIFIFLPVLVYAALYFRPRPWTASVMLAVFLIVYVPWLVRNYMVCGDPRGVAGFAGLDGIVRSESGHMRRFAIDLGETTGNYYAENFRQNLTGQINRIIEYMGWSCVAPLALVSVLHAFRRPITASFRWVLFAMFGSAVIGMGIFGMKEEGSLAADQFYLLFVPLFICYGMAYVLVQWDRRIGLGFIVPQWGRQGRVHQLLRVSLVIAIFLISGIPLIFRICLDRSRTPIEWPPYVPPYMSMMNKMFDPNEIIASDMPWAVAWYADRRSIWLPYDSQDLVDLSDYTRLGGSVSGIFFSPISGTQNNLGDLVNGEYKNWTGYIVRTIDLSKTPYPYRMVLGMPECALYMDSPREVRAGLAPPAAH